MQLTAMTYRQQPLEQSLFREAPSPIITGVVCCSVLQCVAVCYSVLQCVVVCRLIPKQHKCVRTLSCSVWQHLAVCCSVLQCVAVYCSVLQCVAVCCSVLQCVTECCSVLQWGALRNSVLHHPQLTQMRTHPLSHTQTLRCRTAKAAMGVQMWREGRV